MFASERQDLIVIKLNASGRVTVKELAVEFDVTEDSIRKDLSLLAKKGLLKKTYGGAVPVKGNPHRYQIKQRLDNVPEQEQIAYKAVALVKPDDTVFLDISATNIFVARLLCTLDFKLTVITNMIDVLNLVVSAPQITVIFIGGKINQERDGFFDGMALASVSKFKPDLAFIGAVGVDLAADQITTYHVEDGQFKAAVLKAAQNSYLLCEKRKLVEYGNYIFAQLSEISAIIVATNLKDGELSDAKEKGVEVI